MKAYLTPMDESYNRFDVLIDTYLDKKIGIDVDFLTKELCAGLQQNILQLQKDDMMTFAGVGNEKVMDTKNINIIKLILLIKRGS